MKHVKITSNDKVMLDENIECCNDGCPLYYYDTDDGPFCTIDPGGPDKLYTELKKEMDWLGWPGYEKLIPKACPLEDVKI